MPTYTFRNTDTDEVFDAVMKIAEYDQYLLDNPNIVREYSRAPSIGDPIMNMKPSDSFRDILRNIKKEHRNLLSGGTSVETW